MGNDLSYRKRIADELLLEQLDAAGVVLIQGPKWCGKTTTAIQAAKSIKYMDWPSELGKNLFMAEENPEVLLEGEVPRLIDEWQLAPQLWDAARFTVDRRGKPGQFIFTGSAVPADRGKINQSGTGRFAWLTMRPMSLWESGESNGTISLSDIFANKKINAIAPDYTLNDLCYLICRGGWPSSLSMNRQAALRQAKNYISAVCESDISRVDDVKRDASFARRLLRSYARNQGSQVPISTIYADLSSNEGGSMSEDTISSYIAALKKIFVIEDVPAWNPNLRSKTAIRASDTRYFVDPSVAAAALGVGPNDLQNDLNTLGILFETLAIRDLRVYAESMDGDVFHYRDRNGLECDAVIHLHNGNYGLIEVKLGGSKLEEEGAETLKKLSSKIDTDKMNEPSFLMVLTGLGTYAYQRKDGVLVVPIGCLKD